MALTEVSGYWPLPITADKSDPFITLKKNDALLNSFVEITVESLQQNSKERFSNGFSKVHFSENIGTDSFHKYFKYFK